MQKAPKPHCAECDVPDAKIVTLLPVNPIADEPAFPKASSSTSA